MTSWYSNILTKTTSQISSLRSTLLSSEADGDTDDDTHVCRVLRNHYTDKGRPFPAWLPPDPKAPAAVVAQPLYAQPSIGARYGGLSQPAAGGGGGFSSLWDAAPQQQQQQPVRQGRQVPQREEVMARPLPSQRVGSVQNANAAGGGSAQDRLKQRLWGAGRQSPSQTGGFQPPPATGSYEDRFAPGGPYSQSQSVPGGQAGQGRGRQGLPSGPRGYR